MTFRRRISANFAFTTLRRARAAPRKRCAAFGLVSRITQRTIAVRFEVEFECHESHLASCKELSNVVIEFGEGERFDSDAECDGTGGTGATGGAIVH